jgi:hypothetical protein
VPITVAGKGGCHFPGVAIRTPATRSLTMPMTKSLRCPMDLHCNERHASPDEDGERGGKHVVHRIGDHASMLFLTG